MLRLNKTNFFKKLINLNEKGPFIICNKFKSKEKPNRKSKMKFKKPIFFFNI